MADETVDTPAERDRTVGEIVEERLLAIEEKLGLGQFAGKSKSKSKSKSKDAGSKDDAGDGGDNSGDDADDAGADTKEA